MGRRQIPHTELGIVRLRAPTGMRNRNFQGGGAQLLFAHIRRIESFEIVINFRPGYTGDNDDRSVDSPAPELPQNFTPAQDR